ncbi:hypothetical protein PLANPX_0871 [Lacipirellula parvula]|uniref:Uncharacterized protein n=1 Tax=Lacipirellula parvula TaxID=2650471 RepID=A0A5K7XE12_9BACT|nr:hypothetical protein PLANPX_0871 [Lacipirellula parvula]
MRVPGESLPLPPTSCCALNAPHSSLLASCSSISATAMFAIVRSSSFLVGTITNR